MEVYSENASYAGGNLQIQPPVILDLCLRKPWSGRSHDCHDTMFFEKLHFQNIFCSLENENPAFSIPRV